MIIVIQVPHQMPANIYQFEDLREAVIAFSESFTERQVVETDEFGNEIARADKSEPDSCEIVNSATGDLINNRLQPYTDLEFVCISAEYDMHCASVWDVTDIRDIPLQTGHQSDRVNLLLKSAAILYSST